MTADPTAPWLHILQSFPTSPRLAETELETTPPDELTWQSRWFSGAFGRDFHSTDGDTIHITQFGWWNHGAGPDFRDCAITINGELRHGSIELDTTPRDWDHHGHSGNEAYNDTILHLLLAPPPSTRYFTRTAAHRAVPQVHLDLTTADTSGVPSHTPSATPGRCSLALRQLPPEHIHTILTAAARHRLTGKTRRLQRIVELHGLDQAIYQGIAGALGYRRNQNTLTILAQRLSLKFLHKRPADAESLLLGVAGFLDGPAFDSADDDTRVYLRSLWEKWWRYRATYAPGSPCHPLRWNLIGTRPTNHPHRRLATLHAIITQWATLKKWLTPAAFDLTALTKALSTLTHPYWDYHYTLTSKRQPARMALLGHERISDIMANILLPLFLPERPDLWTAYLSLPAAQQNEKTKLAAIRLFGSTAAAAPWTKQVWHQQALLQVYDDFCLKDATDCQHCPYPEQMLDV